MPLYRNGGLIGSRAVTNNSSVSGVWSLDDHFNANRVDEWPLAVLPDPNWSSVVYLGRYENNLNDESGNLSVTSSGSMGYVTTRKFGDYALNKPSGANFLTLAGASNTQFSFGTGDFTIECWVYFPSGTGNTNNFGLITANQQTNYTSGNTGAKIFGLQASTSPIGFRIAWYSSSNIGTYFPSHSTVMTTGSWHHVAVSRSSNVVYLSTNGVVENEGSDGGVNIQSLGGSRLGTNAFNEYNYNAYIDEVRVTKGVARYTSNFTVPKTRFANF